MLEIKLLILIIVANGAPIVAGDVLRTRFSAPLDLGKQFVDGKRFFGPSKTWRGILSALLFTIPAALVFGMPWETGALIAVGAMTGDLLSSFIKRRLAIAPSNQALGLDQIPESLLPLLALRDFVALGALQITMLVAAFFVIDLLLSRLLFKLHLRERPY